MQFSPKFQIKVSRSELHLEVDEEEFWDDTVIDTQGTTALDINIEVVVQEIRIALYYSAHQHKTRH